MSTIMKLAVICLCIFVTSTSGHLIKSPDFWYLETFNEGVEDEECKHDADVPDVELVWVLDLDLSMLDTLKLRRAAEFETKDFDKSVGPLIERVKRSRETVLKPPTNTDEGQNSPHVLTSPQHNGNKAIVQDIMALVNKFIISAVGIDEDSEMPESADVSNTPSLALYLKGLYSAVILKYGRTEWKFFFSYPSPLPDWFYEDHNGCLLPHMNYIPVPQYVENEFYSTISQLLKLFFRVEM